MGTEGSLQCIECGLSGKKRDVRRHIEAKHMANTHVSCSLCGKVVKTRDSLRKHMEKDHREWKAWLASVWCGWKRLAEINKSLLLLSKVMLPQCISIWWTWMEGALKPNFSGLLESMIAKMDDGVGFVCLVCQKVVLHKGNLKKHIVSMHIGESPQECQLCGKSFKNLNSLQNHTSIHHRGLVPVHSQLWFNCLCKCSFSINYIHTQCFSSFFFNTLKV